jgi:hypothetical protein
MEGVLPHTIEYDMHGRASVAAIAQSLLSHERLAREAVFLLEAYVPGLTIEHATVSVRLVAQESPLRTAMAVAFVAAFQPKLEKDVPKIVTDLTGYELPAQYHSLITLLVMMIALYGIAKVMDKLFPEKKKDDIEANYKNLTVVAGDMINVSPDTIDAALRARYSGKKPGQLASFVKGFFAPAEGHPEAKIVGPGGAEIKAEALREIPPLAIPESKDNSEQTDNAFQNDVRIVIHAMDMDRSKSGWAGHIPELFEDRVPMKLDKTIDPQSLFAKRHVMGDVLVSYDVSDTGTRTPTEIHLLRIKNSRRTRTSTTKR